MVKIDRRVSLLKSVKKKRASLSWDRGDFDNQKKISIGQKFENR